MNAITNRAGLPQPMVEAVRNDGYNNSGTLSVTTLIKPPQAVALEREHADEITEDASDRIWSLLGQATHTILERAAMSLPPEDYCIEQRFFHEIEGERVSGQCDVIHLPSKTVSDYKVTSAWAAKDALSGGKPEWTLQLSMLAVLARKSGLEVDRGEIVAILKDWSRNKAEEEARNARRFGTVTDYPQANVVVIPIPLMSHDETLAWMENRIKQHQLARAGHVIACTDEERWARPGAWAAYKGTNKRAAKVEPTEDALSAWIFKNKLPGGADYRIEERPTTYARCASYCAASKWCPQHQSYLLSQIGREEE